MKRLLLLLALAAPAEAQDAPFVLNVEPAEAAHGTRVAITLAHPHQAVIGPSVVLQVPPRTNQEHVHPVTYSEPAAPAGTNGPNYVYAFVVPADVPLGEYNLYFHYKNTDGTEQELLAAPAQRFRITAKIAPHIVSVYPSVSYLTKNAYALTVVGDNFSSEPTDHALLLNGRIIPACTNAVTKNCATTSWAVPGRALRFDNIPMSFDKEKLHGAQKIRVISGNLTSAEELSATLSTTQPGVPLRMAYLAALVTILLIVFPAYAARWQVSWVGGSQRALRAIFLDPQTNTYSLSKFQFYAWTLAAIFGYVYLTAARSLIQGDFQLAPIPEGLPGILLVSIGTGTIAMGVSNTRSKGAGNTRPSFADFVTTGGVVVPERVQFFVWTVLGVIAFMLLVASSDPGTITELPRIPEGFLYLMGISSAGYLGGKFARQPGPIITSATARLGSLIIDIQGRNLAVNGLFMLNDHQLQAEWMRAPNGHQEPEVIASEDVRGYAKQLRLTIETKSESESSVDLPDGSHVPVATGRAVTLTTALTIVNPDGQRATVPLTVEPRPAPAPTLEKQATAPIAPLTLKAT